MWLAFRISDPQKTRVGRIKYQQDGVNMGDKCQTKYPLILVHGTGFRDFKVLNYWGRIPKALEDEGAVVFYGKQDCWGTIEVNAQTVKESIENVISETNCKKVNIIAHSKGGLEARCVISNLGMANKVASLTTIATPHRGSQTMNLLCKLPKSLFKLVAFLTNHWFRVLGDQNPDFYATCHQFSTSYAKIFNRENPDSDLVYYQSYTAIMKNACSDLLLFFPHLIVSMIEGKNDGIVSLKSAQWTNFKGVWRGVTNRGISHADEVDIRRINFTRKTSQSHVSDIRSVYIDIVSDLKNMGF